VQSFVYCQTATPPGGIVRPPLIIFASDGAGIVWAVSVKFVATQKPSRQSTIKLRGKALLAL
jgi:hypothetical protein